MVSVDEDAQILRDLIKHENELTNHRISWLNAVQGLLFAALAFAWDKGKESGLIEIFAGIGIVYAIFSLISVFMSSLAIKKLLGWWSKTYPGYDGAPIIGAFVKPTSYLAFFAPYNLQAILFIVAWFAVLNCTA